MPYFPGVTKRSREYRQTATKTSAHTAAHLEHVLVDSNGAAGTFAVTLKASPAVGDRSKVTLITDHATRTVTIARNGSNINGSTDEAPYRLVLEGDTVEFVYVGGDCGWLAHRALKAHNAVMRRDAVQSINNITVTKILFDAIELNIGGIADATTNDRFDIRRAGNYLVTAFWSSGSVMDAAESINSLIYVSGVLVFDAASQSAGTNTSLRPVAVTPLSLAAGDYVEMQVFQSEGGSIDTLTTAGYRPRMTVTELL